MSGQEIAVALIGFGKAGHWIHAPLIEAVDGLRLAAIVQRRGEEAGLAYPRAAVLREAEAAFADPAIELAVVATPNQSHFDQAQRALRAGKHVIVDKPFTVTSNEADALIETARQQKRVLSVFQNRRYEGDFLTVRRLVEQKALGRIVRYEAHFDRFRDAPKPGAWRETSAPGAGILYDLASHTIDQVLVLFGPPEAVTADVRRERDFGESDDAFDIRLDYLAMRVILTAGMLVRERTPRFLLRGTAGTFVKFGLDPQEAALAAGRSPRQADWGREPREQWGTLFTARGEETIETLPASYADYYANVRDAIAGTATLQVLPQDGATTIRIIEAALQSSRDRRTIALPWPGRQS